MMDRRIIAESLLLLVATVIHVMLAPFTKVEESFNIQATHDLVYKHWRDVVTFDHIEFPGVVPRTFIGPILLSALTRLPKELLHLDPFSVLRLTRVILGILTVSSLMSIRLSLSRRYTNLTGTLFTLITLTQFHILFYASRTLPNTFALILTNFAYAARLQPRPYKRSYCSIAILSVACALFRSELCTYIFFTLLVDLTSGDLDFLKACAVGLFSAIAAALTSITIDSYFWNRLSYPELEVFYFNVFLNKSSAWGTHPFHWYFTNALPRSLGGSYILGLFAVLQQPSLLNVFIPVLLFVCLYSLLPHKELRFIFYALPVFNSMAAVSMEKGFREFRAGVFSTNAKQRDDEKQNSEKGSKMYMLKCLVISGLTFATLSASALQTVISISASRWNYPSGYAMRKLHVMENIMYNSSGLCAGNREILAKTHIDVDSAMNGITRFLEQHSEDENLCPKWSYSKKEDLDDPELREFTHLVSSKPSVEGFCVFHVEERFSGLNWRKAKIETQPYIYLHRNTAVSSTGCI